MNPMQHIDTAPIESAVEHAVELVTDTFSDVTETIGDHLHDDVLPIAKQGARRTRSFVRKRTRIDVAAVVAIALVIGALVWFRKRHHDDDATAHEADLDERRASRSVA